MKKINTKKINLGLIIIFTTIFLRRFVQLPDFIYGLGVGISSTLTAIWIYEFRNMNKILETNK
ncbi:MULTISPECIES: hypothetical protein [Clostridium]|uniref:Uncharacterized protein n=1 Tax=Clostridium nitritogenes TaxID=83340 RepID=A0ABP3WXE4_9CLOT|nr:hypothetical protein [Clostridium baratii]MBT9831934.1 hypothetical protein [Clostridium baratii]MDU1855309.1 hypothetical protein [Clostridium baratii]MDY3208486.1 hypothetical protein [Clostridium baratii]STA99840.1 Uncharacterised protein [Clostridium baratii]